MNETKDSHSNSSPSELTSRFKGIERCAHDITKGGSILLRAAWSHKTRGQLTLFYSPNQGDLGPSDRARKPGRITTRWPSHCLAEKVSGTTRQYIEVSLRGICWEYQHCMILHQDQEGKQRACLSWDVTSCQSS